MGVEVFNTRKKKGILLYAGIVASFGWLYVFSVVLFLGEEWVE